jgi:hypothetical protein
MRFASAFCLGLRSGLGCLRLPLLGASGRVGVNVKRLADSNAGSNEDVAAAERRAEVRARREAIGASARWAVPMQVAAIVVTGGFIVYLVAARRWQVWDWLFVGLFVFYIVNAVSYRMLTRRRLP